jgi:hypothetical protein
MLEQIQPLKLKDLQDKSKIFLESDFLNECAMDPKNSGRNVVVNYSAINTVLGLSGASSKNEIDSSWP